MARVPLATTEDLEQAGIVVTDEDAANSLLRRASSIVRAYAGHSWLDDEGQLDGVPDDIPDLVVGMVERATRNPGGATQETAGPFSRSFGSDAAQRLYLTKMDKLVIRAAVGIAGVSALPTTRGCIETPSVLDYDGYVVDADGTVLA